jgi:phosphoenolpyruvate carboxykinase (ATP)
VKEFGELVGRVMEKAVIISNPGVASLRAQSAKYSVPNELGLLLFHTKVSARSPESTVDDVNALDEKRAGELREELGRVESFITGKRLICVERSIGTSSRSCLKATALVSEDFPHLALMFQMNYFPPQEDRRSDIFTLDLPDWPRKAVYVDPQTNVNIILGSDYYGELKMSALRLAMNIAREKMDSLGVHAGGKVFSVITGGKMVQRGVLVFGLSGTGKTTITVSDHGVRPPESVCIRQDDIMILGKDGYASGTEMNLYPKTDSVPTLPELMPAVTHREAVLENVAVRNARPDFEDTRFNANGRAVAIRSHVMNVDDLIDIPRVDFFLYISRRNDLPPAGRLISQEQAVAYFMLGESVMTSAGTMNRELIGRATRTPGFDPFIIPPKWRSGARLLEILDGCPWITACVLNTGFVGENKIPPSLTKKLVLKIVRGEGRWVFDDDLGYEVLVPEGDEESLFDPRRVYGERYGEMMRNLREERRRYLLSNFPELPRLAEVI